MAGKLASVATVMAMALSASVAAHAQVAVSNVTIAESHPALAQPAPTAVEASVNHTDTQRFTNLASPPDQAPAADASEAPRSVELELSAPGAVTGIPLDFSIAQRASIGADNNGDLNHRGRGSELRVGHSFAQHRQGAPDFNQHRVYAFAASDDQALTWAPGQGGSGHFGLQDRVEVGDHQAGVTYERGNVQASVAYVEREVSATVGRESYSKNENFAGVTLTMRH